MSGPVVAVFAGGVSREKEISVRSAGFVTEALMAFYPVEVFEILSEKVPSGIDANRHVVFSTLHGTFGEDGGMQGLLDAKGVHYAGSDAESSRLCMNKEDTKQRVREGGVVVPRGKFFPVDALPPVGEIVEQLGERLVVKPNGEGSSIGLQIIDGADELEKRLKLLDSGEWLVEERIEGRELTVGVLDGDAMGVVEIMPVSGRYDYESKYTSGRTRYRAPAEIPEPLSGAIREAAQTAFDCCGCRDFARVDFILGDDGAFYFLEINTLPGLTGTSLLPMSASCDGLDFKQLAKKLIMPAIERYRFSKRERRGL